MKKRFPYEIPTGWFPVAFTSDLAPGDVRPIRCFGQELVLFRTESGVAQLFDAYCPHLGAHLGHGGRVKGERLACPFHAWEFESSGRCVHVPYAARQPRRGEVRAWTLIERNGLVMAWHDRAGRPPQWAVPELAESGDPGWSPFRTGEWRIRTTAQEMAENQVDAAHFYYVHGSARMHTTIAERAGPRLRAQSVISVSTDAGVVQGQVDVDSHGLGFTTIRFSGLVETLLVGCPTPIDDENILLRLSFTAREVGEGMSRFVSEAFMQSVKRQLEQDIPIWENKTYLEHPLLVDGDGPIGTFRAWARQFYPSLVEAAEAT